MSVAAPGPDGSSTRRVAAAVVRFLTTAGESVSEILSTA